MPTTKQISYVRVRVDIATKKQAAEALADMGLSISDAIRLLLARIADERRFPFETKTPNKATRRAIEELEAGKGHKSNTIAGMIAELNAND